MSKCFACGGEDGKPRSGSPVLICDRCFREHLWRNEAQAAVGRLAVAQLRRRKRKAG
ncbi:MAG: hypothetical protein RDU41_09730 [Clostridia bacterium]|nr:hypothetical protein [Clostridia bacterium]